MTESTISRHYLAQRVVGGIFVVLIFLSLLGARRSPLVAALNSGTRIPILLFGTDAADKSQHTDTLMVTVFNPFDHTLSLISIPRDTRVRLPGYLFHRVNEIFGYHMRKTNNSFQASLKVKEGVEDILTSEEHPVTIPYFINVDYLGFQKCIDLLDGVWVQVDQPMNYDDNAGNLHIHFEPGRYLLDGAQALRYVRFRGQTGDRGRIYRQHEFLRSMIKKMANPMIVFKFPKMVDAVFSSLHSNLSVWDMVYLIHAFRRIRFENIAFYILPGQPAGPFWQVKRETTEQLMANVFYGEKSNAGFLEPVAPLEGQITINVWNASGKKGLAYDLTKFLRQNGFDVVDWGTYTDEQAPTRIIDRRGEIANAQKVATLLGVENCHSEPNPNALVDVEVILGRDYDGSLLSMKKTF